MVKSTKLSLEKGEGPPDPIHREAFKNWLAKRPREWSVTIAARAALRVIPVAQITHNRRLMMLPVIHATAIARLAAKFPNRATAAIALDASRVAYALAAARAPAAGTAADVAYAAAYAARAVGAAGAADAAIDAAAAYTKAVDAVADAAAVAAAVKFDAKQLQEGVLTAEQVAAAPLWPGLPPPRIGGAWQGLAQELRAQEAHWSIWIDWYDDILAGTITSEAEDAAFTDIPGELPWEEGAEAVNTEIARRLAELRRPKLTEIPDQSPAPVRVEERNGQIAKQSDRDSPLSASERDFKAWRDPVVGHIEELSTSDFAARTNHSRVRDRLVALGRLLPGEIAEVKERQFRIGYEIERFEGLMAAYRSGGEDMPMLNAAQLEDLDRLRAALRMGFDKLERWSEFRKEANQSTAGEVNADVETVGDALDEMAAAMERSPKYFHPELPASFRFLAEAVRDRSGATETIVYGAIKSAENLLSFLGQKALGIGRKSIEAVETHISKAVATSLVAGLSSAALELSGALPHGWGWLKPLLVAVGIGG